MLSPHTALLQKDFLSKTRLVNTDKLKHNNGPELKNWSYIDVPYKQIQSVLNDTIPDVHIINTPPRSAAANEPTEIGLIDDSPKLTATRMSTTLSPTASLVTDTLQTHSVDPPANIAST